MSMGVYLFGPSLSSLSSTALLEKPNASTRTGGRISYSLISSLTLQSYFDVQPVPLHKHIGFSCPRAEKKVAEGILCLNRRHIHASMAFGSSVCWFPFS